MTDYQYLVFGSWEKPEELWRVTGDRWEYFSLSDWVWTPLEERRSPPHPDALAAITPEQAAELETDRQRLVRYWVDRAVEPPTIYRWRRRPTIEEVFGRSNRWTDTYIIREFLHAGPWHSPQLDEIDAKTAERIIQETRGITGATRL